MTVDGRMKAIVLAALLATGCASTSGLGQRPDLEFDPPIIDPAFGIGAGPVVLIDEAHYNFHTADGRYRTFAELLRRDGYVVRPSTATFSEESLAGASVLVISNALNEDDAEDWILPNPSAFTPAEIDAIEAWVEHGGSLFLIADHMPFPGAAADLAERFGVLFTNGYAVEPGARGPIAFTRADGSLVAHPITDGRSSSERVDKVTTFGGQAFRPHPDVTIEPILAMRDNAVVYLPVVAGEITEATPQVPAAGWFQGAVLRHGAGRVAVFGEAAMFSAQVYGEDRTPMGMNDPDAGDNYQLLLNLVRWLTGRLD